MLYCLKACCYIFDIYFFVLGRDRWFTVYICFKEIFFFNFSYKLYKACVRYFYQIFIFSPIVFISSKKPFSFSRYSSFCNFCPSFPHFPVQRRKESRIIYEVMNWLVDVIFGVTQKLLYIKSSDLVR